MRIKLNIIFFCIVYTGVFNILRSQNVSFSWGGQMGENGGLLSCDHIAVDSKNNTYISGYYSNGSDLDPGPGVFTITCQGFSDAYVCKLDSLGNFIWAKAISTIGSTFLETIESLAVDSQGNLIYCGTCNVGTDLDPGSGTYYATGMFTHGFIVKLDGNGGFISAKTFTGTNSATQVSHLKLDEFDNMYLTGNFSGTVDFDLGPATHTLSSPTNNGPDVFFCKLDASGNLIWVKQMGSSPYAITVPVSLTVDRYHNVLTTGIFDTTLDFDSGPSIYSLSPTGSYDAFILKMDSLGNFLWAQSFGNQQNDFGVSVITDKYSNPYVVGVFQGQVDFDSGSQIHNLSSAAGGNGFILKLNPNGNFLSVKQIDVWWPGIFTGEITHVDAFDNLYLLASFNGTVNVDPGASNYTMASVGFMDVCVLSYDSSGNFKKVITIGDTLHENSSSIAFDKQGSIYATGSFDGPALDLDPGPNSYTISNPSTSPRGFFLKLWQFCQSNPTLSVNGSSSLCESENIILNSETKVNWFSSPQSTVIIGAGSTYSISSLPAGIYNFYAEEENTTCFSHRSVVSLTVDACIGVKKENIKETILLYPNPNTGNFNIELTEMSLVNITDVSGRLLYSMYLEGGKTIVELNNVPKGVYLIKIKMANSEQYQKLIIK